MQSEAQPVSHLNAVSVGKRDFLFLERKSCRGKGNTLLVGSTPTLSPYPEHALVDGWSHSGRCRGTSGHHVEVTDLAI